MTENMVKICKECGKEFTPLAYGQKYCTPACQHEHYKASRRKYNREDNSERREKNIERCRDYYAENKEKCLAYQHQYYVENKEKRAEYNRQNYLKTKLAKVPKNTSTLNKRVKEAAACGLQYGEYIARLGMGYSLDDLKAQFRERSKIIYANVG